MPESVIAKSETWCPSGKHNQLYAGYQCWKL